MEDCSALNHDHQAHLQHKGGIRELFDVTDLDKKSLISADNPKPKEAPRFPEEPL
jgi:hypothetical protein